MSDPGTAHHLDQYLAFCLDVQVRLKNHKEYLIAIGWSEPEAWAWCQRIEGRLLGEWMDELSCDDPFA